jgi:tRNA G18 (ribose-2'-O)-methylase SpoU
MRDNITNAEGSFIADSPKVIAMLLERGVRARSFLATAAFYETYEALLVPLEHATFYVATRELMEGIVGRKIHHNAMMHGVRPAPVPLASLGNRIMMVEHLSKSENLGVIARSMAAMGVNALVSPSQGAHPYGRRTLRVSMGHVSWLKFHLYGHTVETILALKTLGYRIFAAEVSSSATPLSQVHVPEKWVVLMGNEGEGLDKTVLEACDEVVQIEMEPHVKSFNVGVAASLVLYRFTRG